MGAGGADSIVYAGGVGEGFARESPQVKSEKIGRVKQGENVKMGNPKRERELG